MLCGNSDSVRLLSMMDVAHYASRWVARRLLPHSVPRLNDALINAGDSDLLSDATRDPAQPILNHYPNTP